MAYDFDLEFVRYAVEGKEKWKSWIDKIPYLKFDPEWEVKVIPPFGGAMARFWIQKGSKHVSVYFDAYGRLGVVDEPYWEIYPFEGDINRYLLGEEEEMLADIRKELS